MTRQTETQRAFTSPEEKRVAVGQFERAQPGPGHRQLRLGAQLLLNCCKLDPGNLTYRKAIRKAQKVNIRTTSREVSSPF